MTEAIRLTVLNCDLGPDWIIPEPLISGLTSFSIQSYLVRLCGGERKTLSLTTG